MCINNIFLILWCFFSICSSYHLNRTIQNTVKSRFNAPPLLKHPLLKTSCIIKTKKIKKLSYQIGDSYPVSFHSWKISVNQNLKCVKTGLKWIFTSFKERENRIIFTTAWCLLNATLLKNVTSPGALNRDFYGSI